MTSQQAGASSLHFIDTPKIRSTALPQPDHCAICLEVISERAIAAPCNHALFDYLCLLTWLLEHDAKCPLCKTEVAEVLHDFVSAEDFKSFRIPEKPLQGSDEHGDVVRRHRRRHGNARSSPPALDPALAFRKHIYRNQLYSYHIGANRISGYRNFTAKHFAASVEMQAKARKWIRRELRVFDFLQPDYQSKSPVARHVHNAEFLLEYIMAMLRSMDIKESTGKTEELLRDFLGRQNARLFLHELEAWLRSPFEDMAEWDETTQYSEVEL